MKKNVKMEWLNGKCKCPSGQVLNSRYQPISCPFGQILKNGRCECPTLQVWRNGKCECQTGLNGSCQQPIKIVHQEQEK